MSDSLTRLTPESLRSARLIRRLKQSDLAVLAHVSRDLISMAECGRRWPTAPVLDRLRRALRATNPDGPRPGPGPRVRT